MSAYEPTEPASDDPVVVTRHGSIATLWLNRPEKRNAVSYEMWIAIAEAAGDLGRAADVHVVVLRGVGEHFSAGADIAGLVETPNDAYLGVTRAAEEAFAAIPGPTVAFVSGACVGGGAQLAIACDLRIADTTSRFGITPARLGLVYPPQAVERSVGLIGPSATKHLLMTAELIDADRALRIGLVDEVHPPAEAQARLQSLVVGIAERSLLTQQAAKEMVDTVARTGGVDEAIVAGWQRELTRTDDPAEGIAAFLEQRSPRFRWARRSAD